MKLSLLAGPLQMSALPLADDSDALRNHLISLMSLVLECLSASTINTPTLTSPLCVISPHNYFHFPVATPADKVIPGTYPVTFSQPLAHCPLDILSFFLTLRATLRFDQSDNLFTVSSVTHRSFTTMSVMTISLSPLAASLKSEKPFPQHLLRHSLNVP